MNIPGGQKRQRFPEFDNAYLSHSSRRNSESLIVITAGKISKFAQFQPILDLHSFWKNVQTFCDSKS